MDQLNYRMHSLIQERMQLRRGRKVSRQKVENSLRKHFGYFADGPFERLFNGCPDPWQVRLLWYGAEATGASEIEWFHKRPEAFEYVTSVVDRYRLYPDDIDGNSTEIILLKNGVPIIALGPLAFEENDADSLGACKALLEESGTPTDFLHRIASLPNISRFRSPLIRTTHYEPSAGDAAPRYFVDRGSFVESNGVRDFTPESAADRLSVIYSEHNIKASEPDIQADLAYVLGFGTWGELISQWRALPVFAPFIVVNKKEKTSKLCRDLANALCLLESAAARLHSNYSWGFRQWATSATIQMEIAHSSDAENKPTLSLAAQEASTWWNGGRANPFQGLDVPRSVQRLKELLGVGRPGSDCVSLSNFRAKNIGILVGRVSIHAVPLFGKGPLTRKGDHLSFEVLRSDDGWRDLAWEKRCKTDKPSPWDTYPLTTGPLVLRTGKDPALGYLHKKEFSALILLRGATVGQLDALKEMLSLEPVKNLPLLFMDPTTENRSERRWLEQDYATDMEASFRSVAAAYAAYIPFPERRAKKIT